MSRKAAKLAHCPQFYPWMASNLKVVSRHLKHKSGLASCKIGPPSTIYPSSAPKVHQGIWRIKFRAEARWSSLSAGNLPVKCPNTEKKDPCRGARTKRRYASCTKIIPFWKVGHYAVYCIMPILKWKGCVGAKSKNVRAVVRRDKNAIDTSLI